MKKLLNTLILTTVMMSGTVFAASPVALKPSMADVIQTTDLSEEFYVFLFQGFIPTLPVSSDTTFVKTHFKNGKPVYLVMTLPTPITTGRLNDVLGAAASMANKVKDRDSDFVWSANGQVLTLIQTKDKRPVAQYRVTTHNSDVEFNYAAPTSNVTLAP